MPILTQAQMVGACVVSGFAVVGLVSVFWWLVNRVHARHVKAYDASKKLEVRRPHLAKILKHYGDGKLVHVAFAVDDACADILDADKLRKLLNQEFLADFSEEVKNPETLKSVVAKLVDLGAVVAKGAVGLTPAA